MKTYDRLFGHCAELIQGAEGLLIGAGAGMGVDSGLPDFRGDTGFWKAYPALGKAGISFYDAATPETFEKNPRLAWGFYGHRLKLYRETAPHAGFDILQDIADLLPYGAFVFTSNVDGQFQKAGFRSEQVDECHGSIHHMQCLESCTSEVWEADDFHPEIDTENCRLLSDLPKCAYCDGIARPNILMFNDWMWQSRREHAQARALAEWQQLVTRLVVIELGAGTAIPSVRSYCERQRAPLIRINPQESGLGSREGASIAIGALAALRGIQDAIFR